LIFQFIVLKTYKVPIGRILHQDKIFKAFLIMDGLSRPKPLCDSLILQHICNI